MVEAALPGAITVSRSADIDPMDIFDIQGTIASALSCMLLSWYCCESWATLCALAVARVEAPCGTAVCAGDAAIAPALAAIKEARNKTPHKPLAELRLHGGTYACRLALRREKGGYRLDPAGITKDDLVSALQAGRPAGAPADFAITLSTVEADTSAAITAHVRDRWAPPPPVYIGVHGEQLDTSKARHLTPCLFRS